MDTTIQKLVYNTNGNPIFQRTYDTDGNTMLDETRYYYPTGVSVPRTPAVADIATFPNPATDQLSVNGVSAGGFMIINPLGQNILSGTITPQSNHIIVQSLPAGTYMLMLTDEAGVRHAGRFIKE